MHAMSSRTCVTTGKIGENILGDVMIQVTRLKGASFVVNAELIESVESTPDTVITLTNGKKYVVSESCEDVVNLAIEYKRRIHSV